MPIDIELLNLGSVITGTAGLARDSNKELKPMGSQKLRGFKNIDCIDLKPIFVCQNCAFHVLCRKRVLQCSRLCLSHILHDHWPLLPVLRQLAAPTFHQTPNMPLGTHCRAVQQRIRHSCQGSDSPLSSACESLPRDHRDQCWR